MNYGFRNMNSIDWINSYVCRDVVVASGAAMRPYYSPFCSNPQGKVEHFAHLIGLESQVCGVLNAN